MRNRIVVGARGALEEQLLPVLQAYAVTPRESDPRAVCVRIEPARTAGLALAGWDAAQLVALVEEVRQRHPLLPVLALIERPSRRLLAALFTHDVECQVAPPPPPALHRFAQRALVFGALPDEAVAAWVARLAAARGLEPHEAQLLCMALANEPRARMRRTLGVGENTLKGHVRSLLRKTGERSLDGLAKNVLRAALLEARPGTRDIYRAPWLPSGAAA